MGNPAASTNKFRQLTITHALMIGGDASMVVALANSFFFDVDPNAARSRILGFLLVSFAPFVVIAPLIGPLIDKVPGGRRAVVAIVAALRVIVQIAMVFWIQSIALFPLVFVALILQKTYTVSKQALVPAAVDDERQLVEANAKLGVIAGVAGALAVVPASILQQLVSSRGPLLFSAALFAAAFVTTRQLPSSEPTSADDPADVSSAADDFRIEISWAAMAVLRALAGYMLFYLAFWFRTEGDTGRLFLAAALGVGALGTLAGNAFAPRLARALSNDTMMMIALAIPTVAGLAALVLAGPLLAVVVTGAVNLGATIGRLAFESVVQRHGVHSERGQAFARFETRFQLGWVLAALVPVVARVPAGTGLVLVGASAATALAVFAIEIRGRSAGSGRAQPTSPVPRVRSVSATPPGR